MESLKTVKRKKRRTRKCLDEIRKRSRHDNHIFLSENFNEKDIAKQNMQTNFITSKRLTLSMFPKAIRSETITRPVLAELNKKPKLHLADLVKGQNVLCTTFSSFINTIEHFGVNNSSSNSDESSYLKHSSINNNTNEISSNQDKSWQSFVLFSSPMNSTEIRGKSLNRTGLNDNCGYNLYEEFMSDIPKYLKHNTSAHSGEDVMKKTKVLLQNLFIENCDQNYENDFLKCLKSTCTKLTHTSKDIIVHNPIDYLRLGHVQHSSQIHEISESFTKCVDEPHSPVEPPTMTASDSRCSFVLQDTPEYTFYPHRLK